MGRRQVWRRIFCYYSNGQIKNYEAYDYDGNLGFMEEFDSSGVLITQNGKMLLDVIILEGGDNDILKLGEKLKIRFVVANPPNHPVHVQIGLYYDGKYHEFKDYLPVKNVIDYEKKVNRAAPVCIIARAQSYFENNTIKTDSIITCFGM